MQIMIIGQDGRRRLCMTFWLEFQTWDSSQKASVSLRARTKRLQTHHGRLPQAHCIDCDDLLITSLLDQCLGVHRHDFDSTSIISIAYINSRLLHAFMPLAHTGFLLRTQEVCTVDCHKWALQKSVCAEDLAIAKCPRWVVNRTCMV
jgi:hypothetical protein